MALSSASRVLAQVFTRKHPSIVQCSDSPPPARWVNTRGTHLPLEPTEAHHDRTQASANECPSATELDNFKWGARLNGPETLISTALPSLSTPKSNTWRAAAAILAFFIQGMNDSAPGALIPYMETHYRIGYAIVSLIFVANAVGFIAAAPLCHVLTNRFGRSKVLAACTLINAAAYVAIACQPPFAVVVIAFAFLGFGFAIILSLDNVFIISLRNGTVILGAMHGFYGIGGTVAPFVATAMVSNGVRWSSFYFINLVLSMVNSVMFFWSFRSYEHETATQFSAPLELTTSRQARAAEKRNVLKKALRNKTTLLGALLIFAYQGAEVSISGWVISFLINYRNGNPAHVGYVTAGFWGGITLSRFLLVGPAHKIGERPSVIVLVAATAAFQILLWFLPNLIANAVAVALIGLMLGPVYPCATSIFSKLLPSDLQITSLGMIASTGSSGGAIAPFFTGLLAQKYGTVVLNPICIALCVVMEIAWLALPRVVKRLE